MFDIKDKDLAGRIGKLRTRKGYIETPYLFPVIDLRKQEVSVEDIISMGFKAVITSAYIAYKRGVNKRIHEALGRSDLIIMTDSGAYQLLEYGSIEVSNKEIIEYEKKIDSDIAVILDVPTGDSEDRDFAEWSVKETLRRGIEALELIDRGKRLWVLPVQGGVHIDLVKYSARESSKLDYDIYALGSPTRMLESYKYDIVADMIVACKSEIPVNKPLHLFGAGHPMIIPFAVALGVDLFDSASYILFARDERYMTEGGTYSLSELEYFTCTCPVCCKYEPRDLMEMDKTERVRLIAMHNLYIIKNVLSKTKQAIKEGSLWELLEEYSKKHPSLYTLFIHLIENYVDWIEKQSPRFKSVGRAVRVYDIISQYNPIIYRARRYIMKHYEPPLKYNTLLLVPRSLISSLCKISNIINFKSTSNTHVIMYDYIVGLIPLELSETQLIGHVKSPAKVLLHCKNKLVNDILEFLGRIHNYYRKITIVFDDEFIRKSLSELLNNLPINSKIEFVNAKNL